MIHNMKAAIFDLDGTLINSMGVWAKIDVDYIKEIGYREEVDFLELKREITHLSFNEVAQYFKDRFNIQATIEEIGNRWHEMAYYEYANNMIFREGAIDFLQELKKSGIKIGLATSNSKDLAIACLKANNVLDLFDTITVTGEVERGKDFPDVYLLAAKRLNVEATDTCVFEDIPVAVGGAKKGGFKVVGVFDEFSSHHIDEMLDKSDLFIKSYTELLVNA